MSFLSNIASSINLGGNWLLFLVILAAGAFLGIALGRNRLGLVIFAGYFSFIISKAIPWKVFLGRDPDVNVQIFIFFAIILGIFFIAPYSGLSGNLRISGRGRSSFWQVAILGILEVGFVINCVVSFLPKQTVTDLGALFLQFFYNQPAQFIWLVLPLVGIMALKKKRSYMTQEE
jgi:hypothetical protein